MKKWSILRPVLILSLATLCLLYTQGNSFAANINWSIANGKETMQILLAANDGFAGKPQRIDTNGILIPFSEVPVNLLVYPPPENSSLIESTMQLGTAFAVKTKTPEFGFVVVKQTPREIIIDFFPDPLGARWKPTSKEDAPANATEQSSPITERAEGQNTEQAATLINNPAPQENTAPEQGSSPVQGVQTQGLGTATVPPPTLGNSEEPQITLHVPLDNNVEQQAEALPTPQVPTPPVTPGNSQLPTTPIVQEATTISTATAAPKSPESTTAQAQQPPQTTADAQEQPTQPPLPQEALPSQGQALQTSTVAPVNPPAFNPFYGLEDEELPRGQALRAGPGVMYRGRANFGGAEKIEEIPDIKNIPVTSLQDNIAPDGAKPTEQPTAINNTEQIPEQELAPEVNVPATALIPNASPNQITPSINELGTGAKGSIDLTETLPENNNSKALEEQKTTEAERAKQTDEESLAASMQAEQVPNLQTQAEQENPVNIPQGTAQTTPTGQPAGNLQNATVPQQQKDAAQEGEAPKQEIIYVDEEGNPVDPPLVPVEALASITANLAQSKFADGLVTVEKLLKQADLSLEEREQALHLRAELLFNEHKDALEEHFQTIIEANNQAFNFNQSSLRNADVLLRIGYMHLKAGNLPEAEAQFNILRKLFPEHENVPLTYYYWGEHFYNAGDLARAADEFQFILQKFPNSRFAKDASLGLARAYYQLGYYQEAFDIVDYIERRWPRFYLDYPPFLNMVGDAAFRLNKLDNALSNYWLYANLEPMGTETDIVLTRIGDIYTTMRQQNAATAVYREAAARFPDRDGGLIAQMRLAEAAIYDEPTILGMFAVFDRPFDISPKVIYNRIITDHAESPVVPLAMLKLAMWHLWQKDYLMALDITTEFINKFPEHTLAEKAKEVALEAYAVLSTQNAQEGRYDLMRQVWEKYPIVQEQEDIMSPESRISLAVSYWKAAQPDQALEAISNFFIGAKIPVYSEMALNLALSIYLEHDQWLAIREVGNRTALWELTPSAKENLDYALALAAENLDESHVAAPLWERLYLSQTLTEAQKAYAAYFLSREAERNNELEKSYLIGLDALTRLSSLVQNDPEQVDLEKVKTQIALLMRVAERAGRLNEALQYAERYMEYLDINDAERASVLYRIARIHKSQGDDESWRLGLEDIVRQYPNTVYGQTAASELKSASLKEGLGTYSPTGNI